MALGRRLFERAVDVAQAYRGDVDGLVDAVYDRLLVEESTHEVDGPLPTPAVAPAPPARKVGILHAEQVPFALAAYIHGGGDYRETMAAVCALGRDTDSIATSCGTWIGGLVGLSGIPTEWVEAVIRVNRSDVDLLGDAQALARLAMART
ncbi:MAG TPA: ADP-ribosylglycohydrolase family protein, partial [Chloroflexota bacterium]|nr:ADP-ribosylglycohydrolase family protein [Chloroflexota bacterium]